MKRKLIIMLAAIFLLTGCAGDNKQKDITTKHSKKINSTSVTAEKETENSQIVSGNLEDTLSQFEDVTNIEYVGNDRLLVITDQMYLIDTASGEILAQSPDCYYVKDNIKVYSDKENIIIVGRGFPNPKDDKSKKTFTTYSENDKNQPRIHVLYYDKHLNLSKKINIFKMFALDPLLTDEIAVSTDGKLAVYDDSTNGLYLCNTDTKQKEKILYAKDNELIYKNKLQFFISGIAFGQNDDKIIFRASCLDYPSKDGDQSIPGYGSVTLDGKELYVEKAGDEYNKMEAFSEFAIISQDCGFTSPTGKIMKYSFSDNKTEVIQLRTKEESNNLYSSSEGNIIATTEENGDKGWNIRFYNTKSGELIKEQKYNDLSSKNYHRPRIFIFENQNIAVLSAGSSKEKGKDVLHVIQL